MFFLSHQNNAIYPADKMVQIQEEMECPNLLLFEWVLRDSKNKLPVFKKKKIITINIYFFFNLLNT